MLKCNSEKLLEYKGPVKCVADMGWPKYLEYTEAREELVNQALLTHFDITTLLVGQCDIGCKIYENEPGVKYYYAELGEPHEEFLFKFTEKFEGSTLTISIEHNEERLKRIHD